MMNSSNKMSISQGQKVTKEFLLKEKEELYGIPEENMLSEDEEMIHRYYRLKEYTFRYQKGNLVIKNSIEAWNIQGEEETKENNLQN